MLVSLPACWGHSRAFIRGVIGGPIDADDADADGSCRDELEKRIGSREAEEIWIDVEQLHRPPDHADAIANHAFRDRVAIEQEQGDRTFLDRGSFSVRCETSRGQEYSMVVIALDRTAELIDLGTTDWICLHLAWNVDLIDTTPWRKSP